MKTKEEKIRNQKNGYACITFMFCITKPITLSTKQEIEGMGLLTDRKIINSKFMERFSIRFCITLESIYSQSILLNSCTKKL